MALNIALPPDTEATLRERAEAQGEDTALAVHVVVVVVVVVVGGMSR